MKIRPAPSLHELAPAWRALADAAGSDDPALLPEWSLACAERVIALAAWEGEELVGVMPLVAREERRAVRVRTLSSPALALLGDAAPPSRGVLARASDEARVAAFALRWLREELAHGWDLIDFGLVPEESSLGGDATAAGEQFLVRLPQSYDAYAEVLARLGRPAARRGVADLPELVRLRQPRLDGLLGPYRSPLGGLSVRIAAAESVGRMVCALAAVRVGTTLSVLVRAFDPDAAHAGAADALLCDVVREAIAEGITLIRLPPGDALGERFATGSRPLVRVRVFGKSAAAQMVRGAEAVRRLRTPRPSEEDARPRLGPLGWARLSLYRGELDHTDLAPPPGLTFSRLEPREFDGLPAGRRGALCLALELSEPYCRQKWARGDWAMCADLDGEPAAVLWCARGPVFVPELDREVRPAAASCYVHDVFVAPWARGRRVAPALLTFTGAELRRAQIERAWALVRRENTASARAFEHAAWRPACEVLYARLGRRSRLLVRPSDREARRLLGL